MRGVGGSLKREGLGAAPGAGVEAEGYGGTSPWKPTVLLVKRLL